MVEIAAAVTNADLRNVPLEVCCDEAGNTGPNLLDPSQRIFSYASAAVTDAEAFAILQEARREHPVQMPELKASKLIKSEAGRALMLSALERIRGRYAIVLYDKLLALCGKVFEYIYEPVLQRAPQLVYEKNLHRFVAMYCYIFFTVRGDNEVAEGEEAIRQFERYMRGLDPREAPLLFDPRQAIAGPGPSPFDMILQFAQGYREIIVADNAGIAGTPDRGKWTLDVAASSLWSLANHWGGTGRPLRILCDDSKPLRAVVDAFDGGPDDPVIRFARSIGNKKRLGWRMDGPVTFGDSRDHPALQLADIAAGAAASIAAGGVDEERAALAAEIEAHIHGDSVMPDFDVADIHQRQPAVNWLILYHLAERSRNRQDPIDGLEAMYRAAEVSWARGEAQEILGLDPAPSPM